jgi:hypothetical protein
MRILFFISERAIKNGSSPFTQNVNQSKMQISICDDAQSSQSNDWNSTMWISSSATVKSLEWNISECCVQVKCLFDLSLSCLLLANVNSAGRAFLDSNDVPRLLYFNGLKG